MRLSFCVDLRSANIRVSVDFRRQAYDPLTRLRRRRRRVQGRVRTRGRCGGLPDGLGVCGLRGVGARLID